LPTGSEIIEVEEDTTVNVGGSGYTVMVGDGTVNNAKQKGNLPLYYRNIYTYTRIQLYNNLLKN
jgi:hypothetical protein